MMDPTDRWEGSTCTKDFSKIALKPSAGINIKIH